MLKFEEHPKETTVDRRAVQVLPIEEQRKSNKGRAQARRALEENYRLSKSSGRKAEVEGQIARLCPSSKKNSKKTTADRRAKTEA